MKKLIYLAVLEKSKDGGYGVYFPDLPGCISYGKNVMEAEKNAEEVLGLHLYGMELDGDDIPIPSNDLMLEDYTNCIIIPITIYPDVVKNERDNKRIKTNVTLPRWLKIIGEDAGVNFSRLLESALLEYLDINLPNKEMLKLDKR